MAKRYKRTGRKCKRCPTCGKTKRVAMKSKRTNRRMYGGRKYRRTRRKAGGRKYFMKGGGGKGGVIVINDYDKDITFQVGFVDEGTMDNFEPSALNADVFPPTKVSSGNRAGVDQGTQDPPQGKDRAIEIDLNGKKVVINRGKGGRHIVHIESNGNIKKGTIKADSPEINTSMSKEEILKYKEDELADVDTAAPTAAGATPTADPTAADATTPTATTRATPAADPTAAPTADAPTAAPTATPRAGTAELSAALQVSGTQDKGAL